MLLPKVVSSKHATHSIESAKTFEADSDNTSDHLSIQMTLNFTMNDNSASYDGEMF